MNEILPPFEFHRVFIEPWTVNFDSVFWIALMGFFVIAGCGLVGNFIILRRMALVGDAVSHSILPGIVLAFLITSSLASSIVVLGAVTAGVLSTVLIELIHRQSRVKTDAALGIVFSTFFAIGVILLSLFADGIHLDAECVLYGEIGYVPLADPVIIGGVDQGAVPSAESLVTGGFNLGPTPVVQMGLVTLAILILIVAFYKELVVTSFDPGLAKSLGIPVNLVHYGLMTVLSVAIVSAFESVGAILVIAMLIFPGATAGLLSDRLPTMLVLSVVLAALYSVLGIHLATWLDGSIAGAMVVAAFMIFVLVWIFAPRKGLLSRWRKSLGRSREASATGPGGEPAAAG